MLERHFSSTPISIGIMKLTINPFLQSRKILAIGLGILCLGSMFGIVVGGKQLEDFSTQIAHNLLIQAVPAPHYQFVVGQQYTYRLSYESHAKSDLRVLFADLDKHSQASRTAPSSLSNDFKVKVSSIVLITVLAKQGGEYLLTYRFSDPIVEIWSKGQLIRQESQLVAKDLNQEIVAAVDPKGQIVRVQFAPIVAEISQTFGRAILADMQFITPNQTAPLREWTQQEEDQNGKFLARYESASIFENWGSALASFRKTKLQYFPRPTEPQIRRNQAKSDVTIQPKGEWQGKFNIPKGQLQELTGKETQKIMIANKEVGTDETEVSLKLQSVTNLSANAMQILQTKIQPQLKSKAIPLSYQPSETETEARIHQQKLGNATLESVLADLDRAEATRNPQQDYTPLYLKIKALVYLQPKTSQVFGDRLTNAKLNSLSFQLLGSALGAVGHPSAQAALAKAIIDLSKDPKAVIILIPNLSGVENPTPETIAALDRLTATDQDPDIVATAELALGTVAAKLSTVQAKLIIDRFVQALRTLKLPEEKRHILLVLGNIGKPDLLSIIEPFTQNHDPVLRAAATTALRSMPNASVDEILVRLLTKDSDDNVRLEAAVALGSREINLISFTAQKQGFAKDTAVSVRLVTLNNLWQARQIYSEVVPIVKNAAANDRDKDVRDAATKLLMEQ